MIELIVGATVPTGRDILKVVYKENQNTGIGKKHTIHAAEC